MTSQKVTADMTITLDGFASGRGQSREKPFGDLDHKRLHHWMFEASRKTTSPKPRRSLRPALSSWAARCSRPRKAKRVGSRLDRLVGFDPPHHTRRPSFSLTAPGQHRNGGGTTFHFVTDGIEAAMEMAREAAGERNVSDRRRPRHPEPVPRRRTCRRVAVACLALCWRRRRANLVGAENFDLTRSAPPVHPTCDSPGLRPVTAGSRPYRLILH